ncbi:MAG: NAD(P)-dependent oxidoreductase [Anaerolineae bacterium]
MKILVTGAAGRIGRVTVRLLLEQGYQVRGIDRVPDFVLPGLEYTADDVTQYAVLREAVRGCDAVIHLAALPNPFMAPAHEVYRINTQSTFNVYDAAAAEGIRRIAQASSINAIGCAWNLGDVLPQYFPLDENHPLSTNDAYSFSKQTVEEIGAYFWRREGISSVSLRFPWVYPEGHLQTDAFRQRQQTNRKLFDELLAMDEQPRLELLADVRRRTLEFRATRPMEKPPVPGSTHRISDEPLWLAYTFDRYNFWTFIDIRDAAQSLIQGVTADYQGHYPLFFNDPHNWLDYDTRAIIRLFFPAVPDIKETLTGSYGLVSIAQAKAILGFEPTFSVLKA